MAKNITLMGANYPDVPAVDLPQTGGGTARFVDPSEFPTDVNITLNTSTWSTNRTKCFKVGSLVIVNIFINGTPELNKIIATGLPIPKVTNPYWAMTLLGSPPSMIGVNENGELYIMSAGTGIYIGGALAYECA